MTNALFGQPLTFWISNANRIFSTEWTEKFASTINMTVIRWSLKTMSWIKLILSGETIIFRGPTPGTYSQRPILILKWRDQFLTIWYEGLSLPYTPWYPYKFPLKYFFYFWNILWPPSLFSTFSINCSPQRNRNSYMSNWNDMVVKFGNLDWQILIVVSLEYRLLQSMRTSLGTITGERRSYV